MNAGAADSYARTRLLELLGIERYTVRGPQATASKIEAPTVGVTVGGAEAPIRSARSAPPPLTVACSPDEARRFPAFVAHLAAALGLTPTEFAARRSGVHTICFGAAPPDEGAATLAPPLSALRISPAAKRAFWRTLRDLQRVHKGR